MNRRAKNIITHLNHYLPLLGIIFAGTLGIIHFTYDKTFQAVLALAVAVSYVFWGVIHHHLHHDLKVSIILEYFLIAMLGVMIVFSLLFKF